MAAHPLTGIDYVIDRFVIRRDGALTNMSSPWGRLDGGPMVGGLPAGEEWFQRTPPDDAKRQSYDHRYSIIAEWQCVPTSPAPPEGWPTGHYVESVAGVMRPAAELKAQVDEQKMAANAAVYPPADKDAQDALVQDALGRSTRTAVDVAVLDRHYARLDAMKQNEARALALHADIDAGRPYDITAGWTYAPSTAA